MPTTESPARAWTAAELRRLPPDQRDTVLAAAAERAYAACAAVNCTSKYYRRDIGARQLLRR